jgi:putative SOS response-associated peptidase YedK
LSFGAITTSVKYLWIRCGGVLSRIGAWIRPEHASQLMTKRRPVASLPTFREAYRKRRCILSVDSFYEWKAIKGQRAKQPYAIAMKDGSPFGIAGIWENWKDCSTGEWVRTFAIITTDANAVVAEIHDRMPAILSPADYTRWLSDEPDPRDLLRPFLLSRCGCGLYRRG